MIYIIGNTLFGYPKMSDIQTDYFKNWFIPYLKKVHRNGDMVVHTGNIFFNKQSANYKVLKDVFEIVDEVSSFIPISFLKGANDEISIDLMMRNKNIRIIKNIKKVGKLLFIPDGEFMMPELDTEYLFFSTSAKEINGLKRSFNGYYENEKGNDTNVCITSPYQLNKDFTLSQHGFYEFSHNHNELRFIENSYSPKFHEIYIDDISELSNINMNSKNFIDLIVKSKAVEKIENKNKLEIFASKNKINNIYYTDEYIKEENVVIKNNDIREILIDNAEESEIVDNLKEIFTIYDNTRK